MRRLLIFGVMVVSLLVVNQTRAQQRTPTPRANTSAQFSQLVDQYFDDYFKRNPTAGTASGFHQYDAFLEDYSKTEVANSTAALKNFLGRFEQINPRVLSEMEQDDGELVISNIKARLLELEEIRSWERNPDIYSSGVTSSVFVIMSRNFAPEAVRLRSVIARERQMPKVFEDARANLKNPPRIYTEIALEQIPGIVSFFQSDVPLAFKSVTDANLQSEFQKSNQAVIAALNDYQKFLHDDVLARSRGDFRIGAENYRKKLLYEEMVDIPLDRLLQIGYENLRANQRWFQETAKKLDPTKTPQQILDQISHEHPEPNQLLQSFRNVLGGLKQFIITHRIITIPSPVLPIVEETPPFERALTFASMDTPGPFETVAKEAFFNVTLPEQSWPREQIEEHMEGFNIGTIISTAVHEAYPGHYVQFLWVQHAPSKVRNLLGCSSNAEGWAHYCEQMMLDEGYGNGDLKLRLGQLQDALLRNARYIVGIEMHRGRMTYEQAIDFFVHEGYQSHANAEREAKRGTSDPTYLVYTLGKLEIMKLREDYKRMRGNRFSLQEFHDAFMRQGFPPIKIIRRALLGNNSPTL